ncbi:cell division protein FtsX [Nitrospira moscoviensis]|uniref:Cell division protein FtsX n=1 Tax=Nitrospira moscoviensis TaxID=42253 RepID=A0A0K2GH69_NITMO|nr:permease-like cell division protein FtsX [Nitrospira moscoviensis]ALA59952.1 putative Cell division protein FtsX [Nitrospira moscoviensis]
MRRLFYLVHEAWANMRTNRTTTVVAILTTAFTLACVGIFLLLYVNLRSAAGWLQDDIKLMVYLDDRVSRDGVQELEGKLKADRMVSGILYISKEQALGEFRAQFPSESHLLEGLGENPLPASFVVTLAPSFRSPDAVKRWAERIGTMAGVAKVDYNQEWIDALAWLIRYIELAAIGVGVILSAAAVTIIGNTIRLALFARREEIEILRLIGATRAFIRIPYVLEGAVLGAFGSALSLGILKIGFELFRQQIRSTGRFSGIENLIVFFPLSMCVALVVVGTALGFAGSFVSLRRFGEGRA